MGASGWASAFHGVVRAGFIKKGRVEGPGARDVTLSGENIPGRGVGKYRGSYFW